jgi:hypothetical protein
MKILQRKWRGIYRHSYRYQKIWEDAENDKIAIKKSEFNSAWEN